jgi:hypothetical protein
MEVFFFYLIAMLLFFTIVAALADLIGHFFPEWDPGAEPSAEDEGQLQIGERASESR